jgi:hypothetical protein
MECMKLHCLKFYHMSNHFDLNTFNSGFNYMMSFEYPFFGDAIFGFTHPNYYKEISLGFKFWCHKVFEKITILMLI